jgi:hypothetical protein
MPFFAAMLPCRHYADIFMPPLSLIAFDSSPFSFH